MTKVSQFCDCYSELLNNHKIPCDTLEEHFKRSSLCSAYDYVVPSSCFPVPGMQKGGGQGPVHCSCSVFLCFSFRDMSNY